MDVAHFDPNQSVSFFHDGKPGFPAGKSLPWGRQASLERGEDSARAVDAHTPAPKWTADCMGKLVNVVAADRFGEIRRNVVAVACIAYVQPLCKGK